MSFKKNITFRKKIRRAFGVLLAIVFSVVFLTFLILMFAMNITMSSITLENSDELTSISAKTNEEQVNNTMRATIIAKAENANTYFKTLYDKVILLQQTAQYLYDNPSEYGSITIDPPKNTDDMSLYATYAPSVDQNLPEIQEEQGLVGNLGGLLLSINTQDGNITSDYIATESGIMVQTDELAKYSLDEKGNMLPFDAKSRLWYKGAVEHATQDVYFTDAFIDASTGNYAIVASAPVFKGSQLKGVVGIGMLLEDLNALVSPVIEQGTDFIIDYKGNVINSSASEGELTASRENPDSLFAGENSELGKQLKAFLEDGTLTNMKAELEINGEPQVLFCAKITSVGWIYASCVPKTVITAHTEKLREKMDSQTKEMIELGASVFCCAFIGLGILLVVMIIVSALVIRRLSNRLIQPIKLLSEKVNQLDGENLDFQWEELSGDEFDILANKFGQLTQRIQNYIQDITTITAEKERISTELSVATQIQADMLPIVFPPFPERNEFEIFASMTPAKEVGGDFYDFFMLDDDHLAMVIGDVSGKGVPAALFMVISKTLIKDHAQMCGSPKGILEEVNNLLLESNAEGMFVTVWLGILEISTGKVVAANAGHEYPAIQKAGGEFDLLKDKHGMMVGAMGGIRYKEYEFQLEKGDCLFVYTDGVPEATNAQNELYGTDRMVLALNQDANAHPQTILKNVRADVDKFVAEAPQFDDLTMLCIRYFGNEEK